MLLQVDEFIERYKPVAETGKVLLMTDADFADANQELYLQALAEKKLWTTFANKAGIMLAKPGTLLMGGIGLTITEIPYTDDEMDTLVRWDPNQWGELLCEDCEAINPDVIYPMIPYSVDSTLEHSNDFYIEYQCLECNAITGVYIDTKTLDVLSTESQVDK